MNIAYLSADFGVPVFGYKGASVHVREMVAAFHKAGHAICVISPAMEREKPEKENTPASFSPHAQPGDSVVYLPVTPPERHLQLFKELETLDKFLGMKTRIRQELRNLLYNLTLYETVLEDLRACRTDLIYERYSLFSYAGIRLARELGVPHILEVNAPLAYEQEKMRGLDMKELARETERRIFRETDRVIVVSRQLQEFVASCGVPESRIHILPNAVDPQRFALALLDEDDENPVRAQYRLNGKRVIGFVGSLKPWHGTETLLEAFRNLHTHDANTHLLIVGDGPGREALEHYAQSDELNGAVTFPGNVPYDDIPHYIAAMDITVAPYTPNENFYYSPIKIFEYMMMGKPVVAAQIGQVEEVIIDGETGVLFEPGNIEQLTAALIKLSSDPQLCRRIGENAKAWVQKERTWDNNARQVLEIARGLLQKRVLE
ncbi:MAG: glycosyltransferase family 4 protein [candidate division KSB1 bacterium]|nr:glycosyltransferase family 4 protein [candidate division KSB1 bacterium]MDZ7302419.1 glycosyltransferase family 4 protein [candidate division KSB1 bacterium]MDZ7311621.1 glycosyltransferase family 4 protein [candidate division KSB1 bacterium]